MATLTTAVNASATSWVVDALPTTHFIQVDDEIVEVEATFASIYDRRTGTTLPNKLRVLRAALGTSAASHSGGATLVPVYGAGAGGGGSLTLDNTVDPPAEVTTIIASGAIIDGAEATLPGPFLTGTETESGHLYRGDEVPTVPTPEEGDVWVDTTGGAPFQIKTYANDEWVIAPIVAKDVLGVITAQVEVDPQGTINLTSVPGAAAMRVSATGDIEMNQGDGNVLIKIAASGAISLERGAASISISIADTISATTGSASVQLASEGVVNLGGTTLDLQTFAAITANLPTVDPVAAGTLWADAGVVKVSAG